VALRFTYYNFICIHSGLGVPPCYGSAGNRSCMDPGRMSGADLLSQEVDITRIDNIYVWY
jgi:hypothetical protein